MLFYVKIWTFLTLFLLSCSKSQENSDDYAVFGGGCFWTLDYYFEQVEGVKSVKCIYTQNGSEAVFLNYDSSKVSFYKLCQIFMKIHSPETAYKEKYRSVIQTDNEENLQTALNLIKKLKKDKEIKTVVEKVGKYTIPDSMHEDWHKLKKSEPKCFSVEESFEEFLQSLN